MIKPSTKDIHSFLNDKNALVVHFSGCPKGAGPGKKLFPEDLKDVLSGAIPGALSCSVVIPGDYYSSDPAKGNAMGTVGVILDVDGSNLSAVDHRDAGSRVDGNNVRHTDPKDITPKDLENSLSKRATYNEWVVIPYDIKGIFIFNPNDILVRKMVEITDCDEPIEGDSVIFLKDLCSHFPASEIYTFIDSQIAKLDRNSMSFYFLTEKFYG